ILNSKPYEYTIKEVGESNNSIKFDGKWFKVIYSGNMKDGIKVTNTLIPTTPPPMPPEKPKLPKTGVGINTLIYAGISSISGGIILLFLRKRKVKNEIDV
ncbi:LPXTG cell wall anchor domain-containing protein, partial [Parvimonas micra]|uniref:LPXTG cell wall anchor domain-containing protein n=1 Tax=Parvimonas micra TaxID=33033 RepID=UPI002002D9C3